MRTPKILLLGKTGQLGWELQRALAPLGELVALGRGLAGQTNADLTNVQELALVVRHHVPDIIVNAAAYTAVDKAQSQGELARQVNTLAVGVLAQEAKALDALLLHFSTDYVFNGQGQRPWLETDMAEPLNVYGQTKWEGEELIRASHCQHLIVRTSWVYGSRGDNFAKIMLRLAKEREELKVVDDQFGAPTGADLLADLSAHMLRSVLQNPALQGTYHAAAEGCTSWFAYAKHVIERSRMLGQVLKISPEAVNAIPSKDYLTPAKRPLNSRLNCTKLENAFSLKLPTWQSGVDRMLQEYLN